MRLNTVLNRYLFRQGMAYLLGCLLAGTAVYLLADTFDRLDDFVEAGLGASTILRYYGLKLPLIISQILPGAYLLAMVVLLSVMVRSRELVALQAGGVSQEKMMLFFIMFGLLWSGVQFGFSQGLGTFGQRETLKIWNEQVRNRVMQTRALESLWFREGGYMVSLEKAWPALNRAEGVRVFILSDDSISDADPETMETPFRLSRVIQADEAETTPGGWILRGVTELNPENFNRIRHESLTLSLNQDLRTHLVTDSRSDPGQLPLWQLADVINRLERAGSNVEGLRTTYHMKISYAFSILVMSLLGLAIITWSDNIFLNILLSLLLVFAYYGIFILGVSSGEKGLLPPAAGAWAGNFIFGALALARLLWHTRPRYVKST